MNKPITTAYNYEDGNAEIRKEWFEGDSKTVPGQVPTLKKMLERYAQGGAVEQFQGVYLEDDQNIPDNLERMTEQERKDYAKAVRQGIKEKQDELLEIALAKKAQAQADKEQATKEAKKKERTEPEDQPAEVED